MSKSIIIDEAGLPKALTVDALRTSKQGGGTEDWVFAETASDFIKMSAGKNVEVNASDYGAHAITEVDVTQAIYGIETQEDKSHSEPQVVSIKEGNTPRYFSQVKKLRVRQQSDNMASLIPNFATGTLYATKRGHYVAKNDGYEGYSKVYVDVPESSDGTGEDGGWTDLPDEIRVIKPPVKTVYTEGEIINYTGMVIKAYANGEVWSNNQYPNGIIPLNEIIFDKTTALKYDQNGDATVRFCREYVPERYKDISDKVPDFFKIKHGRYGFWKSDYFDGAYRYNYRYTWSQTPGDPNDVFDHDDDFLSSIFITIGNSGTLFHIALNGTRYVVEDYYGNRFTEKEDAKNSTITHYLEKHNTDRHGSRSGILTYTVNGKTINGGLIIGGVGPREGLNDNAPINTYSIPDLNDPVRHVILYSMIYGEIIAPIHWKRPRDETILSSEVLLTITDQGA